MTPDEARARFAASRVATLATLRPDGQPHLVPVVYAAEGDVVFTVVDDKPKRSTALRRLANIEANPRVSLLAHGYDEDWARLWWIRADGTAEVHPDGPMRQRAVSLLLERYPQYGEEWQPIGPAVVVSVDRWSGWEAGPAA